MRHYLWLQFFYLITSGSLNFCGLTTVPMPYLNLLQNCVEHLMYFFKKSVSDAIIMRQSILYET